MPAAPADPPRPLPIFTLVMWLLCAAVGGAGLLLRYPWPAPPKAEPPAVVAVVPVELPKEDPKPAVPEEIPPATQEPVVEETTPPAPVPIPADLPPAPPPWAPPDAPAFTAVAAPSDKLAFAVPVAGPTRLVTPAAADSSRTTGSPHGQPGGNGTGAAPHPGAAPGPPPAPPPQTLIFGQGEGKQEKPDYPREALRRRQEGTVGIRFAVDETGAVTWAEVAEPCEHPLLNAAALAAVKKQWRFPPGGNRMYRVSIRFQFFRQ